MLRGHLVKEEACGNEAIVIIRAQNTHGPLMIYNARLIGVGMHGT